MSPLSNPARPLRLLQLLAWLAAVSVVTCVDQRSCKFTSVAEGWLPVDSPVAVLHGMRSRLQCVKACMTSQGSLCLSLGYSQEQKECRLYFFLSSSDVTLASPGFQYYEGCPASCPTGKGYVSLPGTIKCVLASNDAVNWWQAADNCVANGSQLIIIENADVMQKLQNFLRVGSYHVGFNDLDTENQHLWLDKTPVDRSLFHSSEPNDYSSWFISEDCGMVNIGTSDHGLHDVSCSEGKGFICSLPTEM